MKIEKVNDNQIRCTVTLADLQDRPLKISDLLTNPKKAKLLLHDMVQQAATEFGFEVDGMSLMIETTPGSKDSVVFTITRLSDDSQQDSWQDQGVLPNKLLGAETVGEFFKNLRAELISAASEKKNEKSHCIFSFDTLEQVIYAAGVFDGWFEARTNLYKDNLSSCYLLFVFLEGLSSSDFNRACNLLSEYAVLEESDASVLAYVHEHAELVLKDNALQSLAELRK